VDPVSGVDPEPLNGNGYTFWEHAGFGQHFARGAPQQSPYVSRRVRQPMTAATTEDDKRPRPGSVIERDLGGGVSCHVPVSVYYDHQGTLPRGERLDWNLPADWIASGNDRATRLAGVVLAWNVFQHFYPYFDVVDTDWPAVLEQTLASAAEDPDAAAFGQTLGRMVAELHDGHGRVGGAMRLGAYRLPFGVDWIEDELVVTAATHDAGVTPGDVIVSIDGSSPDELWDQLTPTISAATPQWLRYRVSRLMTSSETDEFIFAELRKPDGSQYSVRAKPVTRNTDLTESRPRKITEVRPGIWYVDIDRITDQDFNDALRQLKRADGIVFDLRGYPGKVSAVFIAHLIDEPVTSAQWHVPLVYRPDRERMTFRFSNWTIQPKEPRLTDRVAILTDGRAISAAETYLGIIEHYQLAHIVGSATAGTNGNVNPIRLPGGYTISWTGMKVLKHDGSRHHGVGILPTIPVHRTIRGVAAGRDEVLERGIEAVSKP
jgi:C-terminal processing protease CtpA/Prc